LNKFVAAFKNVLKRVSEGLRRNGVQFGRHVFRNVFNILKPLPFESSFHPKKEKKDPLMQVQENKVSGLSPQHCIWLEISSLPVRNG
jgi:hypothetical protein